LAPPDDFKSLFEETKSKIREIVADPRESSLPKISKSAEITVRGKKGHPDYNQVTVYLKKDTHNKAKIALLQNGNSQDFSELVEDLLNRFLKI
jgi:hypothetical protein